MIYGSALDRRSAPRALLAFCAALLIAITAAPAVQALGRLVPVIVMGADAGDAADLTRAAYGEVDRYLPIVDGVAARVSENRLAELRMRALVVPDRAMKLTSDRYDGLVSAYPAEVGATSLWSEGYTGGDVTVALVDTGIADVPDLQHRIVARANFTRERTFDDTYGHGTFQAGVIAGDGSASEGRYTGIAPAANLFSVKVANAAGETSLGQVLAGVQLVDIAAERFGIRVALLALSSGSPLPPDIDPLSRALRILWAHGIVVVVPAGNEGPGAETITSPGEDPVLLTAGSVDDHGTASTDDDSVSDFSSRGPTRWNDDKPDVAAPGEHLVSLRAPGSTVDRENPSARVEDAYFKGSGTSMSAAVTAGAAVLLLDARPDLSPDHVKALLMATAAGPNDGDGASVGAGIVNAAEAVALSADGLDLPDAPEVDTDYPPRGDFNWLEGPDGVQYWVSRSWASRSWNSRSWDGRTWNGRTWSDEEWDAHQWSAREWASRTWDSRTWDSREWASRSWAGRTWAGRTWAARHWAARHWDSRSWSSRSWSSRTWSDVEWSARAWSSRTWSSRSWTSRSWG